ncbi:hypothetical protein [Niallia sp. 03133]|uniref:hypothetical protein n=1 Tax=Niallia sp. 03133 TaxID=3458060 RepID=UPI004045077F
MITFLLILSFIFNILAFLFIALLFVRQNRFVSLEKQQKQSMEEVENLIAAFIVEMKEENELFLQKMKITEKRKAAPKKEKENIEKLSLVSFEKEHPEINMLPSKKQAANVYKKTIDMKQEEKEDAGELLNLIYPLEKEDPKEKSLLEKVLDLKEQGKNTEEIAKILNKGKTEIELFLKFRQKNHE